MNFSIAFKAKFKSDNLNKETVHKIDDFKGTTASNLEADINSWLQSFIEKSPNMKTDHASWKVIPGTVQNFTNETNEGSTMESGSSVLDMHHDDFREAVKTGDAERAIYYQNAIVHDEKNIPSFDIFKNSEMYPSWTRKYHKAITRAKQMFDKARHLHEQRNTLKNFIRSIISETDLSKWSLGEGDSGIETFQIDDAQSPLSYEEVEKLATKMGIEYNWLSEFPDTIQSETGGYTPYRLGIPKHQSDSFLMALEKAGVKVEVF